MDAPTKSWRSRGHHENRESIARRNPGGPDDGWIDEAAFLSEAVGGLSLGVEVGPADRKACIGAIGLGPAGSGVDVRGWAESLPFADGSLEYVVANHVIEHCADPVAVLREWHRALRPCGVVALVAPDCRDVDTFSLNPEHKHETDPEVLRGWLRAAGYAIVREAIPVPHWSCAVAAKVESESPSDVATAAGISASGAGRAAVDSRVSIPERVAVVYDSSLRPDTTGGYCLRALEAVSDPVYLAPERLADAPSDCALYLCIDDGLDFAFPQRLHPSAFWAIDTHLNFPRALSRARQFDVVFAAQKEGAARLLDSGIGNCEWLPLACDPEIHRRLEVEKEYDVAFVGHVFPGARQELLEQVQRRFPRCFIGQAPHTEMAQIYSRARIAINCSLANDLNMRVFEAMSCGAMLITNRLTANGQEELFRDRVHLVKYETVEEALDLIDHYLRHEDDRHRIAEAGHQEAVTKHTYRQRMGRVLERMKQPRVEREEARPAPGRHDWQYFHWPRPDLLELVPQGAKRVLDVGCAAGVFGEILKRRDGCEVVGIELHGQAAEEARGRLDQVIHGDVETLDAAGMGTFDAIVCGDVLEHLRDPEATLRKLRSLLSRDGTLVASFPNVRHMEVLRGLVNGNWTYQAAGLLDRDHLRFFTRRSAEQLLENAGFTVAQIRAVPGKGYAEWEAMGRPGELRAGKLGMSGLSADDAAEFFVGQWLITAQPAAEIDRGLTSIIVVTWDQLPYTQLCLDSIRDCTRLPHEIIVVDNGSTDGTVQWLAGQPGIQVIRNAENRGFAAAANQGLRAARGANLLLLNNDTVVTSGWLRRLLEHLHASDDVGLVGPTTNFASGEQQIRITYESLSEVDGFAWDLGRKERGRSSPTDRLVGFCLLMKRAVVERIGLLDEQFEVGCFEDDDICRRAAAAGYRLLICRDAFVHHFGGRTFIGHQLPMGRILEENRQRFLSKWQEPARQVVPTSPVVAEATPNLHIRQEKSGALILERTGPTISLCMIVKDEEAHLADCLHSIRSYVDEMIIVDTGSTDRTPDIAQELGVKVYRVPWQDSFSAARNASLDRATGDWIFWMDADDVINEESGHAIREAAAKAQGKVFGFIGQVRCPPGPGEHGETVVDHVKLFRNRPELRFELRIHEQILPAIRRAGGEIARAPIEVRHAHYDYSPEGQARKRERDRLLLEMDLHDRPDHPFVHFNIGMTAAHEGDHDRAIHHLRRSLELADPQESHVRKAYALLASAYRAKNDAERALAVCREARQHYPNDPELLFNEALSQQLAGRREEAAAALEELLNQPQRNDYLGSVDVGILSYKARQNLGVIYQEMGKLDPAERCWQEAVAERPDFLPGWIALIELLLSQSRPGELEGLVQQADREAGAAVGSLVRGQVALKTGDLTSAEQALRRAASLAPHEETAHRLLSHALLQRGERVEVEGVLHRLIELCPDDGEAYHNLGSLLMEQGRTAEATIYYRQAVQLRPDYLPSREMFRQALQQPGAAASPRDSTGLGTETKS